MSRTGGMLILCNIVALGISVDKLMGAIPKAVNIPNKGKQEIIRIQRNFSLRSDLWLFCAKIRFGIESDLKFF